jgi:hypothetical protein
MVFDFGRFTKAKWRSECFKSENLRCQSALPACSSKLTTQHISSNGSTLLIVWHSGAALPEMNNDGRLFDTVTRKK